MASINDRLSKLREERIAREKARIEKLRDLNLKKYSKADPPPTLKPSTTFVAKPEVKKTNANLPKNNLHVKGTTKRPVTAPAAISSTNRKSIAFMTKQNTVFNSVNFNPNMLNNTNLTKKSDGTVVNRVTTVTRTTGIAKITKDSNDIGNNSNVIAKTSPRVDERSLKTTENGSKGDNKTDNAVPKARNHVKFDRNLTNNVNPHRIPVGQSKTVSQTNVSANFAPKVTRKSFVPKFEPSKTLNPRIKLAENSRKSMPAPQVTQSAVKLNPSRQSVFERLYQPKVAPKKPISDAEKLQTDPNFLNKVIKNTGLILNKRRTMFEPRKVEPPVRRSISAVHFKRISKSELGNCIHKWSSIGDKLDEVHLQDINEDAAVKEDKIISAVKSERKKVKFLTPIPCNFNTPRPEELQSRLQNWLQKRGKSIDSYHHLQCFGLNHIARKEFKPLNLNTVEFDDEDKENQPVESDSDNDSYDNNMNNKEVNGKDKWRRASAVSESVDFNESLDTTLSSSGMHHVDELLFGALNDLTELLREGFDWEQCARWLRAIRDRFPLAPKTAQYWECRAALEERRGDLPASVQCWEEAIAKGTERSVVEANLDQLLDKFMQLKISPNSGKKKQPDPKMVDVKNVFKSTLIRFAVQQASLRESREPRATVTPVRRSARLCRRRTPLQLCTSVRQASEILPHPPLFVPNDTLHGSP